MRHTTGKHSGVVQPATLALTNSAWSRLTCGFRVFSHRHPFFLQGTKTLAYELWEDLGFHAPDNVIIPTGAGSNILGCDLGFGELLRAGEIAALPRLFCAQPLRCSPIATAILAALGQSDGREAPAEWNAPEKTMAEGTSIASPVRLRECVDAVVRCCGSAVRVTEEAMAQATLDLAALGLYTEPTCAQAAAAFHELMKIGRIKPHETTVIVLTSTGVKATPGLAQLLGVKL
jgi:threonine synthase